jgi:hypothetical protein
MRTTHCASRRNTYVAATIAQKRNQTSKLASRTPREMRRHPD